MKSSARSFIAVVIRSVVVSVLLQGAVSLVLPAGWTLGCAEALAQGCAECSGTWQAVRDADSARASCPEGRETRCYQAYLAAQNRFTSCLDQGCDTGMPQVDGSGGGESGSTSGGAGDGEDGVAADADGDGVPDGIDACRDTTPGLAVDARGCPVRLVVTVSTPVTNAANEVISHYAPGDTVVVSGTVRDGGDQPVAGAGLQIEMVGTEIWTVAGTMVGTAYYESRLELPLDIADGSYTITTTASKDGWADGSASTMVEVRGAKLSIGFWPPANVPVGATTEWKIPISDEDDTKLNDARVRVVATHLGAGTTVEASGLSKTPMAAGLDDYPWFTWTFNWSEEHAGEWQLEIAAEKKGFTATHRSERFTVGAHLVELGKRPADVRCYPWCSPECRYRTVIIDHDSHNTTPCYIPAKCSLGHDLRYEWTAEGGTIDHPAARGMTWRPPQAPGSYTIRGQAICSEDPAVRASFSETIEATTRALFWKSATQGKIEMRGFDRVKVEKIVGEDPDVEVSGNAGSDPAEYDELEEGRWLEGEQWQLAVGLETKVTLGVYRDGTRVGEVEVGEMQFYKVKRLRRSTFGWLPSADTSPYIIFVDVIPDRRYKVIDFSVSTATEVSSVRGTTFFVAFDDVPSAIVGALEGEVTVTPRLFDGPTRVVARKQWTSVDASRISAVTPMTDDQLEKVQTAFLGPGGAATGSVTTGRSEETTIEVAKVVYSNTFSGDKADALVSWEVDEELWVEVVDGVLLLEPDEWGAGIRREVPLADVCVALDGWVEKGGFTLSFANREGNTFHASLGEGASGGIALFDSNEIVASVQNETFMAGAWSRFDLCLHNGLAEVRIGGQSAVSGPAPAWLHGTGTFSVSCWGWPVQIDNVAITALP